MSTEASNRAPLSFAQERLWLLDRMLVDRSVYNVLHAVRLSGMLDVAALRSAINALVRRHEVLRTHFAVDDGQPVQVIDPELAVPLAVEDLGGLLPDARAQEALRQAQAEAHAPFDLARGPLLRARLLRLGETEHWLLLTLHHVVTDGYSTAVLWRELSLLYGAGLRHEPSPLPALPVQYADYVVWQREWLQGEALAEHLSYWKGVLADLPTQQLPLDRARPAVASHRGGQAVFAVDAVLTRGVKDLARREGATLFMTLLAAFQVLLHRWSGQEDIPVGVPIAGRSRPELEGLIGFFVNMLVIRGDLRGAPGFTAYLARVRRRALEAYAHQELPFEKLVEHLAPKRDASHNPLFQVSFALQNAPAVEWTLPGLDVERVEGLTVASAKFDLSFALIEAGGTLRGRVVYSAALFDASTIERMVDHYLNLLGSIVAAPGQRIDRLPLQSAAERERLLVAWNRCATPDPEETCVHRLVETVAARAPAAPAVIDGDRAMTYGDLNASANQLAHLLRERAPGSAPRVGLFFERGADLVVAMVGVLKAGGSYVPLDPELPGERLAFMLQDADVSLVVTTASLCSRVPVAERRVICVDRDAAAIAAQPTRDHDHAESSSQVAYVIYTSGSSGTPKGVLIPHRAIARLVQDTDYIHIDATDTVAHVANPAFDAATFEVWGALVNGARIVIVPRLVALSPRQFAAMLQRAGVTTLFLTTALFNQMARYAPSAFSNCRTVLFGGEAVEPRWVRAVLDAAPPGRLLHVYGPTETTTFATWHEIREVAVDAVTLPIGRPIAGTEVYLLDAEREPVPIGVPGELYIGGPGLAAGYLNQPELTAERFIRHPFADDPHARLYRTGDRVRYRADGAIEFLGRLDRQVKIRGHRIELEDVEAAIARLPHVREAAVAVRGDTTETRQLIACVVAADSSGPPPANLWAGLKSLLPEYMLPASIVWLKSLPINASGKIDRGALLTISVPGTPPAAVRVAPRDMFEQSIVGIWERLLNVDGIGVFDHFFELGGHSLLAAQLVDEIERESGLTVPLAAFFADDTIDGLARLLRECPADLATPIVPINDDGARLPLVFLHGSLRGGGFYSRSLAHALGPDQPMLVVQPHTLDGSGIPDTIEAMAADHIRALRAIRPRGPYCVGGFCNGALIAFEMARQLIEGGDEVPIVFAIQARAPQGAETKADEGYLAFDRAGGYRILAPHDRDSETQLHYLKAMSKYTGGRYDGRLVLIHSRDRDVSPRDLDWVRFSANREIHVLPGDHTTLVTRHVGELAQVIRSGIERVLEQTVR